MARKATTERHGDTRKGGYRRPEYIVWVGLIQRCINSRAIGYENYGGRGIKVCSRWRESYIAFRKDMGRKPSAEYQIERVNNNGNYEPGNCKWALRAEQSRNRRSNRSLTVFGKTRCVVDWAFDLGASPSSIVTRIARGWSVEDAVSIPPDEHESHSIEMEGKVQSLTTWAREKGIAPMTVRHRILVKGWTPEDAFSEEPGSRGVGRKPSVFLTVGDCTMTIEDWSHEKGLNRTTIEERIKRGWSHEDAVLLPLGARKPGTEKVLIHGTIIGYSYYGCRCSLCKKAKAEYRRKHP